MHVFRTYISDLAGNKNFLKCVFRALAIILYTVNFHNTFAQSLKPQGEFLTDSIEVGKPFLYALSFKHAPDNEVFFPDSSFSYAPFEILSRKSFTSVTNGTGKSTLDSAIYQFVTFDVSKAQILSVPVFVYNHRDCTAVFTIPDTILLRSKNLAALTEDNSLKPETTLTSLRNDFNFSMLLGYIGLAIAAIGAINWVFGKDINKQWRLIKLQRRHLEYLRSFNRLLRNAREKNNIKDAENAIIVWKNYLERLERKPFATYTTREIMDNMPDDSLAEALKNMDGIIYGQVKSNNMHVFLEELKTGATRLYRAKRRQILDNPIP